MGCYRPIETAGSDCSMLCGVGLARLAQSLPLREVLCPPSHRASLPHRACGVRATEAEWEAGAAQLGGTCRSATRSHAERVRISCPGNYFQSMGLESWIRERELSLRHMNRDGLPHVSGGSLPLTIPVRHGHQSVKGFAPMEISLAELPGTGPPRDPTAPTVPSSAGRDHPRDLDGAIVVPMVPNPSTRTAPYPGR